MSETLQEQATQIAIAHNISPTMFVAQIQGESSFNPNAYNSASGATGIAQFLPSTAENVPGYGQVNPNDPIASLNAAAAYDQYLTQQTGSAQGAIQSYLGASSQQSLQNVLNQNPSYAAAYAAAGQFDAGNNPAAEVANDVASEGFNPSTGATTVNIPNPNTFTGGGGGSSDTASGTDNFGGDFGGTTSGVIPGLGTPTSSSGTFWDWLVGVAGDFFERSGVVILGLILITAAVLAFARPTIEHAIREATSER